MSKGSRRRPVYITREEEEKRWNDAFGKRITADVREEVVDDTNVYTSESTSREAAD